MSAVSEDTSGRVLAVDTAAFGAAADATVVIGNMHFDGRIIKVEFVPSAAITANGTNFSTLTLQNKGGLKTGTTAVASRAWSSVNSVAATKEAFALSGTAANLEVKAGDRLDLVQTHGGTGLAIPTGSLLVTYLPRF
jgi:hypothetical protein